MSAQPANDGDPQLSLPLVSRPGACPPPHPTVAGLVALGPLLPWQSFRLEQPFLAPASLHL